ncbi:MAG: alpha-glucuronidase [Acetatifactor sp.]|nr:alpha-glucuronidase [Acetatifactor sp.]
MKNEWTQAWLAYEKREEKGNGAYFASVAVNGFDTENVVVQSALKELKKGIKGMLDAEPMMADKATFVMKKDFALNAEGYTLTETDGVLTLAAGGENGLLYGVFEVLRRIAMEKSLQGVSVNAAPDCPLRMLNHWDNMDNSIERGYSGESFFFEDNEVVVNDRTVDYARLAASVGINGVVINNVNVKQAASYLITDRYYAKVAEMAKVFADYGIKFFMSLNYASTIEIGGMNSADPLDPEVISWWEKKIAECYANIPNLGGFLVKADSEGRPGPFTYGRTQADGANMLADIIKPYGGIIIWRCFVYNCQQDWRDYKTDRARAGYDNFIEMDGDYHENVILQIKNGPMDFQIREPISPLLGGLKKTNQMLEVQVAQEYTGHQIDVCYLMPMFKEVLDFKTYCSEKNDCVKDIISGKTLGNTNTGIAAVINTGNDKNWTGNDLAAANFYGFGRLGFDTELSSEEIAEEWIRLTFGNDPQVIEKVMGILLPSRATYEKYTSPLGIGWMVTPHVHYGCSVDGYEYSRWGTYHRADHLGIGVDRSHNGTGYALQYHEPNASMYDSMETCPEELLLFFHHVPYTYVLKSGKTLIQHIYDTHFEGVEEVEKMIAAWESLKEKIAPEVYDNVSERFGRQLTNAREWRDQVNSYFYRKSGIPDEKGRQIW